MSRAFTSFALLGALVTAAPLAGSAVTARPAATKPAVATKSTVAAKLAPAAAAKPAAKPARKTAALEVDTDTWLGKVADRLPKEKAREMLGFFAPVVKKHQASFVAFNAEYLAAADGRAVIRRYLPTLEEALADAKAMKVPERYEAQKASYLKLIEPTVMAIRLYANFSF